MATRSSITVKRRDGKYASVYCHWDGYPDHQMPILTGHYASQDRAEELVSHGDMSLLGKRCDAPEGHSFDTPHEGCTVYYGRDRGEDDTEARVIADLSEIDGQSYNYLWDGQRWTVGS